MARDFRECRKRDGEAQSAEDAERRIRRTQEKQNAGKAERGEFGVHTGTSPGEGERVRI